MMYPYYLLDQIDANPWQPRASEDAEHTKNLAASILADGMMQIPVGRLVGDLSGTEWRVQLAFGHSRLAAYKLLRDSDHPDFEMMPVVTRELSDEQMITMAIEENVQRRDLSPMEEARAMLRLRDEFGKTSGEIGAIFGLAESSVRNKIRLLGLPEEIQEALGNPTSGVPGAGHISEGAARELITLFEMPQNVQMMATNVYAPELQVRISVVRQALAGATAEQVRGWISEAAEISGHNLSGSKWKWDEAFDKSLDERIVSETCKGCSFNILREKKNTCVNIGCFAAREDLIKRRVLALASVATGIRPAEDLNRGEYDYINLDSDKAKEIRGSGCENLRLVYTERIATYRQGGMVDGHPNVLVMCSRRNGQCTCANGIDARLKLAAAGIRVEKQVGQGATIRIDQKEADRAGALLPGQTRATTAEDLKDLASQARRAKKQLIEEVKGMQEDFSRRLVTAFENRNSRVMAEALLTFVYSTERYKFQKAMPEEILFKAMLHIAERLYNLEWHTSPNPGDALRDLNNFLKEAGLHEMESAISEPVYEAIEEAAEPMVLGWKSRDAQTGKTLVEVYNDEDVKGGRLPGQMEGETLVDFFARTEGE